MQQGGKTELFPPAVEPNRDKVCWGINDLGGAMLRLTFLLCSGLFLVMLLGGREFGQLRPGLAQADAAAKAVPVTADVPVVETAALAEDAAAKAVAVAANAPVEVEAPAVSVAEEAVIIAAPVVPSDQVLQAQSEPALVEPEYTVFTLSDYADPAPDAAQVAPAPSEQSAEGEVWYVAGNSLNVRSGPSTNDAVVGKLTRGEATLVVWREGPDWARIRIEGDGIEGYVAMRFLTPDVPAVN